MLLYIFLLVGSTKDYQKQVHKKPNLSSFIATFFAKIIKMPVEAEIKILL